MDRRKRAYHLYSLGRLFLDETALAIIMLWLLPEFGLVIPLWLLSALMLAWAAYSLLTSRLVGRVIGRTAAVGPEALMGARALTTTCLSPGGYLKVSTELWRARSISGDIDAGSEVVIVGINGLTLLVKLSADECATLDHS